MKFTEVKFCLALVRGTNIQPISDVNLFRPRLAITAQAGSQYERSKVGKTLHGL